MMDRPLETMEQRVRRRSLSPWPALLFLAGGLGWVLIQQGVVPEAGQPSVRFASGVLASAGALVALVPRKHLKLAGLVWAGVICVAAVVRFVLV